MFQKDPQVLMAHPDQGLKTFADLKGKTLFLSRSIEVSAFRWMKATYHFDAANVKPYNFNSAPFCRDKTSAQQGYLTSEPFSIEKECGFKPQVFLIADAGFDTYSTTIETRKELVEKNPDLVQRFVNASIIGWANYLYGDNTKANELIKKDNPEMSDERITMQYPK